MANMLHFEKMIENNSQCFFWGWGRWGSRRPAGRYLFYFFFFASRGRGRGGGGRVHSDSDNNLEKKKYIYRIDRTGRQHAPRSQQKQTPDPCGKKE